MWFSSPSYWFLVVYDTATSNVLQHFTPLSFPVPSAWNNLPHVVDLENSSSSLQNQSWHQCISRFFPNMLANCPLHHGCRVYHLLLGVNCKYLCQSFFTHFLVVYLFVYSPMCLIRQFLQPGSMPLRSFNPLCLSQHLRQIKCLVDNIC